MKVLYLIGNGFDLAYGLKTRYTDFYEKFIESKDDDTNDVKELKSRIRADYETWADLEEALGQDTINFKTPNSFEDSFYTMKDALQDYLSEINDLFKPSQEMVSRAIKSLINPEYFLEEADRATYDLIKFRSSYPVYFNLVTFNYTYSLEKLLGNKFPMSLSNEVINAPRHIHGVVDDSILMGVNDTSQLSNVSFRNNVDLQDIIVKPTANDAMRNLSNAETERLIGEANLVVLFGLSLGETDKKWWQCIGKQYSRDDFALMYFHYNREALPPRRRELTRRVYRQCVQEIMKKFEMPESMRTQVENKTFITVNKPLFGKEK